MKENYTRSCLLLILLLSLPIVIKSQDYNFDVRYLNIKEGLPNRFTKLIAQDDRGYIWISSRGILSRFDGVQFKNYDADFLGVQDATYLSFSNDSFPFIWLNEIVDKADKNYRILNSETGEVIPFDTFFAGISPFKSEEIAEIRKVRNGFFYIVTITGAVYEYSSQKFIKIYQHHAPIEINWGFYEKGWLVNLDSLFQIDAAGQISNQYKFASKVNHIRVWNDGFLVTTLGGRTFLLQNQRVTPYSPSDSSFLTQPYLAGVDMENFSWWRVNNNRELVCLKPNGQIIFKYKPVSPITNKSIKIDVVFFDRQNNAWVSTEDGVVKISRNPNPFKVFMRGHSTRGIVRRDSLLMINSYSGSQVINIYSGAIKKRIFANTRLGIFDDGNGIYWIGQERPSCLHYDWEKNHAKSYENDDDVRMKTCLIFRHPTTKKLWSGSSSFGLSYINEQDSLIQRFRSGNERLDNSSIRHFFHNEKGMWVSTSGGLYLIDNQDNIIGRFDKEFGFKTDNISFLHQDEAGIYWIGTKGKGLIRWDFEKDEKRFFSRAEGLLNENIYAVYEDDFGFLWLPSDYGLMRFDKNTFNVSHYSTTEGIPHEEFNTYSHYKDSEGNFYFGSLGGVIMFHPKDFVNDTEKDAPLFLTSVQKLGKDEIELTDITEQVKSEKTLYFNPSDKYFELHFALLDFQKTEENRYAYQIEGFDQRWQYSDNNRLKINTLPYGDFNLKVKGKGKSGLWSANILELKIKVLKPFYLQYWFFVLIAALIVVGFYVYVKWREQQHQKETARLENEVEKRTATISKQAEELKSLDKAKSRFFSNITHEFRTPLTLIIGPLEQFLTQQKSKRLSMVLQNAKQLQLLINQLLDISKLENKKMQVEAIHGDIVRYTENLVNQFQEIARQKDHRIYFNCPFEDWRTHFDQDKWNKIIYNLLSNAIKFTPKGGVIQVNLAVVREEDDDWITLMVQDTGRGISAEKLPNIFDRFFQADSSSTRDSEGTGIGLALVKELVEVQKGTIQVSSRIGKGTTFEIRLPILKTPVSATKNDEFEFAKLPIIESQILNKTRQVPPIPTESAKNFEILIIEDNSDMRQYIQSCIEDLGYLIREAKDGQEGIKMASEHIPDLIISDIMMPKKDGFELTSAIRNDLRTSHIPVVLLTAKAALESRLEGFERGADAYLSKPFSPEELVVRIKKLIELRQRIQQKFKQGSLNDNEITKPLRTENKFIKKTEDLIIENLLNEELSGEFLAKNLFLSRGHFYRKMKALTNQTPHQFINMIRVKQAIPLLQSQEYTVSEVAYEVGFSTPSYFARIFKQLHGKSPSEVTKI